MQTAKINVSQCYTLIKYISEGTFGKVYSGVLEGMPEPGKVAVKRVTWKATEGLPRTTMREVSYMQQLQHPNIVRLRHVCVFSGSIDIIMDLCQCTLYQYIGKTRVLFEQGDLCWKTYAGMALPLMAGIASALAYCHAQGFMHRDVSPRNILMADQHTVKLADFGAMTTTDTAHVVHNIETTTLWYRSPEQLLGEMVDTPAIDAWSLGAVLLEMMWLYPIMPGKNDDHQLAYVLEFAGYPTPESWPRGLALLARRKVIKIEPQKRVVVNAVFDEEVEVAESLLVPNPKNRMSCAQAEIVLRDILKKNENVQKQS